MTLQKITFRKTKWKYPTSIKSTYLLCVNGSSKLKANFFIDEFESYNELEGPISLYDIYVAGEMISCSNDLNRAKQLLAKEFCKYMEKHAKQTDLQKST